MREDGRLAEGVLVLCTANRCRSIMTAAFLRRRLAEAGQDAWVRSAGIAATAQIPPREVVSVMAAYGFDVGRRSAQQVNLSDLDEADLILTMAREHVRHAVVAAPGCWDRAFTLKEIVRRGQSAGGRMPGESFSGWIERMHNGRNRRDLLGDCVADDVADPIGAPERAYLSTAAELDGLVSQLAQLCWGSSGFLRATMA